ncbi:MAG: ABC transporter transmembrane domain-containing protein [Eubacteriales bacterium]
MKKREELTKTFCGLYKNAAPEDVIVAFEYDLESDAKTERRCGIIGVTHDKIVKYLDGEYIGEYDLCDTKEWKCVPGVGCTTLEFKYQDDEHMLCRADMAYNALYAAIAKRLNRYIETHSYGYDYEKDMARICPKCGRPLRPGSEHCEHCVSKGKYLKRIWEMAKPYRGYIYLSIVMYFVITACNLITPYINRVLVDDFIQPKNDALSQFIVVMLSMLGVNILIRLLSMARNLSLVQAGTKLIVRIRSMVFDKIQLLSLSRISKRTSGELMNRVTGDTATLREFITQDMGNIVEEVLVFLAVGIYLFVYDWRLALMILLPTPIVMFAWRIFWKRLHSMYDRQWTVDAKASTVLHDIFSGIRVVKAFGMEHSEVKRYDTITKDLCDISIRNERTYAVISPIINFFMGIGEFFLLYYVGTKILGGQMTLGEMAQFSAYVGIIYGPLRWFSNLPRRIIRVMTSIVKIFDIIDEKVDVADSSDAKNIDIVGTIEFDDASFGYDDTVDVLKHINLKVNPGEMIGIVGKSGVGKSTLINLVMRLYDVNEGSIKIDGTDIREISQECLRSQIGVVLQETFLFSGTIYDNIAYAKPDATRDEIINAAKVSGAHPFIMKLPEAYNTKVGERGFTLSGGERQRISIARALLHNPRILILDEATAALDTETEKQIQDSLQKLMESRTTLAIAHRLSTLRNATRLIVLDKNTVAEIGTHDELMKKKGIYYGLVMAQRQMSKMQNTKSVPEKTA